MQKSVQDRCVELCFGFFQRIGYTKTANCLLDEAETLSKLEYRKIRVNDTGDGKEQFVVSFNDRVHDKTLEEIIELFIHDGRFDVSRDMLQFGEELRHLTNRYTTMTSQPNMAISTNHHRLYGRPSHSRHSQPMMYVPNSPNNLAARSNTNFSSYTIQQSAQARAQLEYQMINQQAEVRYRQQQAEIHQHQQQQQAKQVIVANNTQNIGSSSAQTLQEQAATTSSSQQNQANDESFDRHGASKRKTHHPQSLNTMAKEHLIDPLVGIINEKPWESVSDINLDDSAIFQSLDCIGKDFLATFDFQHNDYPQYPLDTFENGNLIPIDHEVVIGNDVAEEVVIGSEHNLSIEQGPPVLSPIQKMEVDNSHAPTDRVAKKKDREKEREKKEERNRSQDYLKHARTPIGKPDFYRDGSPKRKESSSSTNLDRKQREREKDNRDDRRRSRNHEGTPSSSSRRSHSPQRRNDIKPAPRNNRGESTNSNSRKDANKRRDREDRKTTPTPSATKKRPYPSEERASSSSSRNEPPSAKKSDKIEKPSNSNNRKSIEAPPNPPKRVASPQVVIEKIPEKNPKNKMASNLFNKLRLAKNSEQPPPTAPPKVDVIGDIDRQMDQFDKKTPDELQAKKSYKIPKKSAISASAPSPSRPAASTPSSTPIHKSPAMTPRMTPPSTEVNVKKEKIPAVPARNISTEAMCEGDPDREFCINFIEPKMSVHRLTALLVNVNDKYMEKQKSRITDDDLSRSPTPEPTKDEMEKKVFEEEKVPTVNTHPKSVAYAPQKGAIFAKVMASRNMTAYSDDEDDDDNEEDDHDISPAETSPIDQETSQNIRKTIDLSKASDVLDKLHQVYD